MGDSFKILKKNLMNVQLKISFSSYVMSLALKNALKTCNNVWGIIMHAINFALVGETVRYPFMSAIAVNMLRYLKKCTCDDILLRNAYKKPSAAHDQYKLSWVRCVKTILKFLDLNSFVLSKAKFKRQL